LAIADARRIIECGVGDRIFPAAAVEVGDSRGAIWSEAFGALSFDADAPPARVETPFDLASLTKVIATTSVVLQLAAEEKLGLNEPIRDSLPDWRGADRERVTVLDLLEHASGLPARLLDAPPSERRAFEHDICTTPLEYEPRSRSIYSDVGFILLGFLAADRARESLEKQFDTMWMKLVGADPRVRPYDDTILTFDLPLDARRHAAPTQPLDDDPRRGRLLIGEVHDAYAAALGGIAGHAGLFGTAPAVGAFAGIVLRAARGIATGPFSPACVAIFTTRSTVPGSSRALGWDTMLPTSSCGTRMSATAFGHVGFTGTSLWIDPARDRYYVLLTNRACGGGALDDMRTLRRAFHDALADA